MKSFSIRGLLSKSWELFRANWAVLIIALIISIGVSVLGSFMGSFVTSKNVWGGLVVRLIFWVVQMVFSVGMIRIALLVSEGKEAMIAQVWKNYRFVPRYFMISLIGGVLTVLGFVLLIVPGIYLSVKLQFAQYFMIDQELGSVEAIKASWHATKGNFWKLLLLDIVVILLNFVGVVLLVLPILITAPLTMLMTALAFRSVLTRAEKNES